MDLSSPTDVVTSFRASAGTQANRVAVVCGADRISFEELASRANRVANALRQRGVAHGDRIALLSKNSAAYVELFLGALSAGACVVPLPTMASPEHLKLMMLDSRAKLLMVSEGLRELAAPFAHELTLVEDGLVGIGFGGGPWRELGAWLAGADATEPAFTASPEDPFCLIYSSGTTGVPKGIVLSHGARWRFVTGCAGFGFAPGSVNIASTPLYSNTTMVGWLPSVALGATNVVMEKFDARRFLELVQTERVTHAMLVPVQYDRILALPDVERFDLSSLAVKLCTSAPLRAEVKEQILARIPGAFFEIYGLTEGGVSTILAASARPDKLSSVGQPGRGCQLKIIDEHGAEVPAGTAGEIVGRNEMMMDRYENQADATSSAFWRDPAGTVFFRSGDLGRLDDEGFLYLVGRKKDMIISGGFNIYPSDLEAALHAHPEVHEAAVIGVPSVEWGETPLALVVMKKGAAATAHELLEWANGRLGKGQRISKVEIRDDLPRSAIGKVLKRELREPYWASS